MPVASTNVAIGPEARIFTDGLAWAVIDGTFRHTGEEVVVTDTETSAVQGTTGVFDQRRHGLQNFELNATMQFDVTIGLVFDPFQVPLNGNFIVLRFLPSKLSPTHFYRCPVFKVFESSGTFTVRGSPPTTMRMMGKSDGVFQEVYNGLVINGGPLVVPAGNL